MTYLPDSQDYECALPRSAAPLAESQILTNTSGGVDGFFCQCIETTVQVKIPEGSARESVCAPKADGAQRPELEAKPGEATGGEASGGADWVQRLAWVPIPILLSLLVALSLRPTGPDLGWLPLLPVFNFVFLAVPCLLAAGLAARTYLVKGSPAILFLGSGTLAYAATALLASWPVPGGDYNTGSTTWFLGSALAGFFILLSAFWLQVPFGRRYSRPSLGIVVSTYSAVLLALTAICLAARYGLLPAFFVNGVGPTALLHTAVGVASMEFTAASLLVLLLERHSRSAFLHCTGWAWS